MAQKNLLNQASFIDDSSSLMKNVLCGVLDADMHEQKGHVGNAVEPDYGLCLFLRYFELGAT